MIARVFRFIYHACWYAVAATVLFLAVAVTLLRLMLPHISDYREEVQVWVGKYFGYPVEISRLDAEWQGWRPTLFLEGITLYNADRTETLADLRSASISLDPVFSLYHRGISPLKLTVSGPDLSVILRQDGSINIARGGPASVDGAGDDANTAFAEWLTLQKRIAIQDARVRIIDDLGHTAPLALSKVSLDIKNSAARTQVTGSASLPPGYGNDIRFAFDFFGYLSAPDWSGQFYLEGNSIYPFAWLAGHPAFPEGFRMRSAPANLKIWGRWRYSGVEKMEGVFDVSDVSLPPHDPAHAIRHLASSFSLDRLKNGDLNLSMAIHDYRTASSVWPAVTLRLTRNRAGESDAARYTGHISYLRLEDLAAVMESMPVHADYLPAMKDTGLRGILTDAVFVYDPGLPPGRRLTLDSDFDQLEIRKIPSGAIVSGLGGHLQGNAERGSAHLDSASVELGLPSLFDNPFNINELQGVLDWRRDGPALTIETGYLEAHTLHFNSRLRGRLVFNGNEELPYLDMMLNISDAEIENVSRYLPSAIPEKARQWIDASLVSGKVSALDAVLRGNLEDFPFDNGRGRFAIIANAHDATLDYHPKWPPIDGIEAELTLNETSLAVNAVSGKIFEANIREVLAEIPDVADDKPLLNISGRAEGSAKDALSVIINSPLAAGEGFADVTTDEIEGPVSLDLELDIPLYEETNAVKGVVTFHDAVYDSPRTGVRLDGITGSIGFTGDSIGSERLGATYHGHPVEVGMEGREGHINAFSIKGTGDSRFILDELGYFFPGLGGMASLFENRISGASAWTATLSRPASSLAAPVLVITSSLSGLSLDLPAPFGKSYEPVPLEIATAAGESGNRVIRFAYGPLLKGYVELDQTPRKNILQASLHFGETAGPAAMPGNITVTGRIDQLSFTEWLDFLGKAGGTAGTSLFDRVKLDVTVASLEFLNQAFNDAGVQLANTPSGLEMNINAGELAGRITLPKDTSATPVSATFSNIAIREGISSGAEENYDPARLPPLKIHADKFSYKGIDLGELELAASRTVTGLSVDSIAFTKPDLAIQGSGTWERQGDAHASAFKIELQAARLDAMLQTFHYSVSPIKDGQTTLSLKATWPGSPMDFSLANINGNLDMKIDKGQFMEIRPNAGRLFGLLSLQALPRRLSLDFTDLFSEGLSFDHILGDFSIEKGNAYTNNLTMAGPSANIDITGRTGLVDQDYDQIVTVTPQVANSLPVASALFGPIGVGVGAVIFLAGEIFESLPKQIDKLLRYKYTIKGSWEDPVVEQFTGVSESSG